MAVCRGGVFEVDEDANYEFSISCCDLAPMCEEGLIVKVGYGRYRAADFEAA